MNNMTKIRNNVKLLKTNWRPKTNRREQKIINAQTNKKDSYEIYDINKINE